MTFKISWAEDQVRVDFSGKLHLNEVEQAGEKIYSDSRFARTRLQIFNYLNADCSDISLDEARQLAWIDVEASRRQPKSALAVVSDDEIVKLLTEHYKSVVQLLHIQWRVEFFRSVAEAEQWFEAISTV